MNDPDVIPSRKRVAAYLAASTTLTLLTSWFWHELMFGGHGPLDNVQRAVLIIPIAAGIVGGRIAGALSPEPFLSMGVAYVLAFVGTEVVFLTGDWTMALVGLFVSVILAIPSLPAAATGFYVAQLLRRRSRKGHCPQCNYNLRGDLESGCPECGWGRIT